MNTIFKYPLAAFEGTVDMVYGAKVVHVAMQHGTITLWAIVEDHLPTQAYQYKVIGTGHECPWLFEFEYLGTAMDGTYVWHVFLEKKETP